MKLTVGWDPLWKQAKADTFYGPAIAPVPRTAAAPGGISAISTALESGGPAASPTPLQPAGRRRPSDNAQIVNPRRGSTIRRTFLGR